MSYKRRNKYVPPEMYESWGGEFNRKEETMTWTKDTIGLILDHPFGNTDGISHTKVIGRMLLALYARQTQVEKSSLNTREVNGVGFNKFDAEFLSSCAEYFKKYGTLTTGQIKAVSRSLKKYSKQLEAIAEENKEAKARAKTNLEAVLAGESVLPEVAEAASTLDVPSKDPKCTICGHERSRHEEEPPYPCYDCGCDGFSYAPVNLPANEEDDDNILEI